MAAAPFGDMRHSVVDYVRTFVFDADIRLKCSSLNDSLAITNPPPGDTHPPHGPNNTPPPALAPCAHARAPPLRRRRRGRRRKSCYYLHLRPVSTTPAQQGHKGQHTHLMRNKCSSSSPQRQSGCSSRQILLLVALLALLWILIRSFFSFRTRRQGTTIPPGSVRTSTRRLPLRSAGGFLDEVRALDRGLPGLEPTWRERRRGHWRWSGRDWRRGATVGTTGARAGAGSAVWGVGTWRRSWGGTAVWRTAVWSV